MIDQKSNAPRRYFVDPQGHRVLIGLSCEETTEFEKLDLSPFEASGSPVVDRTRCERRWLELYARHEEAWRAWIARSRAEQVHDSGFVNHS